MISRPSSPCQQEGRERVGGGRAAIFLALAIILTGCPKTPLAPPPKGASGPAGQMLAAREQKLGSIRADAVIRMRLPPGMEGAPGGKVHAVVIAAARPDRARLEILTPLGTPGATVLLADGLLQVYQPIQNQLMKGPLASPELESRSPLPVPMNALPDLLRGAVPIAAGTIVEADGEPADAATGKVATRVLEVRRGDNGPLVQRVVVDAEGGYPLEDVRYDEQGNPELTVTWLEYGGVETTAGTIAFPQKVKASVVRPEGVASLEVTLSNISINPSLGSDTFVLSFERDRPPRVEEFQ